ncbi:MAG: ATP12 family chaperone protein [Rickettsiales bacterium]
MVGMSKAKAENRPLPKRFYAAASMVQHDGNFAITLDGKFVRTPQQQLLQTSTLELAQYIVAEWEAQQEFIDTDTMPLTRLLNIALDRVAMDRDALLIDITGYGETDLLCYRAPLENTALPIASSHDILRAKQVQHFDPILDWAHKKHGMEFVVTDGLMPVLQPEQTMQKIATLFAAATDHQLAALAMLVPLLGSALLVLAVWEGVITIEAALVAARLDEAMQGEQWGEDVEVAAKWSTKMRDARAAAVFLQHTA